MNLQKLVNGRSVFGVGDEGVRLPIGTLLVDDAHSCLSKTEEQFTLKLKADHAVYIGLFSLFEGDLRKQSQTGILSVIEHDPTKVMLVPFWAWQVKQPAVARILHASRRDEAVEWAWPLMQESLTYCQCVFGGGGVEISTRCVPIDIIPSFGAAKRRVYMTATLADDSVLISAFHADPKSVRLSVHPKSAGDLGDRMILAPQQLNPEISDDELKAFAKKVSARRNTVVIVPSGSRAEYWADVADLTLTAKNLEAGVDQLKGGHVGLVVMVNKYDGVDLPNDACRVLIIDGLPEVPRLIDRIDASVLEGSNRILSRHIQRIEQGMGRGIRANNDSCVVLLMGSRLIQRLSGPAARPMLTEGTLAQITLSMAVAEQLDGKSLTDIYETMRLCLEEDPKWLEASRGALATVEYSHPKTDHSVAEYQREAFDLAQVHQLPRAVQAIQKAVEAAAEPEEKGWLKQQLAEYVNRIDAADAQQILLSALSLNPLVLKPIDGIAYAKFNPAAAKTQAECIIEFYRSQYRNGNELVVAVNSILDDLIFREGTFKRFERAIDDLARHLGFQGQRPDAEFGVGPDNLWLLGELKFLVIECKNEATADLISKEYANQLSGSMNWFKANYDDSCRATPIIVHRVNTFSKAASPHAGTRVVSLSTLDLLKDAVRAFTKAVAAGGAILRDTTRVAVLLEKLGLTRARFVDTFTEDFALER